MRPAASPHATLHPSVIDLGGLRLHHLDAGPREAPALLLLPGIVATHRYWRDNVGALAERFRVLAPDLPGFGRSDKPDVPYTTAWFVEQVARFLDAKGVARAHFVGNSLGGQIAMAFALAHRQRVERLVLVAPAGISTDRLRFAAPLLAALDRVTPPPLLLPRVPRPALALLFRSVFPGRRDLAARYTRGYASAVASDEYPLYFRAMVRAMRGCLESPMIVHARNIEAPTLIVWGARDALLPVGAARALHRAMPNAALHVYERSGHCPMVDEPARFNDDVLRFLA
jgi:pimeloyl-ACP methyl ester carboxylesterase